MTLMAEKLAEAGVDQRIVRLDMALAEFRNNGGTYEQAQARLDAAYQRGGAGHPRLAEEARVKTPDTAPTDDDTGHVKRAEDNSLAISILPASSLNRSAAGQGVHAHERATCKVPRRAPNPPRPAAAIAGVQGAIARSLFDTIRLPDGRRLRQVAWGECPELARRYRRASRILMAVHHAAQPADSTATLDSIVSEERLREIVDSVERFNDVV